MQPFSEVCRHVPEGRELAGDPEGDPQQSNVGGIAVKQRPFPAPGWWGGAQDHGEGALCGGALTPSGSHALAQLCTCLRARARRGAPAAAAGGLQTVSRQSGGGVPGVPGGGPRRAPLFCKGHICGRGVPNSGNSKEGAAGGRETPSIPPNTKPGVSSTPPHSCEEGAPATAVWGAEISPYPVEGEDLRTS